MAGSFSVTLVRPPGKGVGLRIKGCGTIVSQLDPQSVAARGGLLEGDTIVSINGRACNTQKTASDHMSELHQRSTATYIVEVRRGASEITSKRKLDADGAVPNTSERGVRTATNVCVTWHVCSCRALHPVGRRAIPVTVHAAKLPKTAEFDCEWATTTDSRSAPKACLARLPMRTVPSAAIQSDRRCLEASVGRTS